MRIICVCTALSLLAGAAAADTLTLRNGDRLSGEIARFKAGVLEFDTDYAGTLRIAADRIAGLATDKVVTVKYKTDGYSTGRLVTAPDGTIRVVGGKLGRSAAIDINRVAEIYPGTELPSGLRWSGIANLGATQRAGNTDSKSLHLDASIKGRSDENRVRFEGEINREITDGNETQDDFTLFAQHDNFVTKTTFFYTNVKLEKDQPRNVKLRTTLGTGGGLQLIESDRTNLSVEAGPSYINEDAYTGSDDSYTAGRWAVHFDHYVWKRTAQFFHRHEGKFELGDTGNLLIDSSTGLRFPLSKGFMLTAKVDIDYDARPSAGASRTDRAYLLTVGYEW